MRDFAWNGDEIADRMEQAVSRGLTQTAAEAVRAAKPEAPIQYGALRGSIRIDPDGIKITGLIQHIDWGSFDIVYARAQDQGYPPRNLKPHYFMKAGAEKAYPNLAENIRRSYEMTEI